MRPTRNFAPLTGLIFGLALYFGAPTAAAAQDCMIGEMRLFAGNFAPRNWAKAQGQLLSISHHSALFSILGTTYGGDGRSTFALPDLRSRVPIGEGTGPGLTRRRLGEKGGEENHTLTIDEMPVHDHDMNVRGTQTPNSQRSKTPENNSLTFGGQKIYTDQPADAQMAPGTIGPEGGDQPHNNMQPFIGMNYIICLNGIYPSRS